MADLMSEIQELIREREALETRLQNEKSELPEAAVAAYEAEYTRLQRRLATIFKKAGDEPSRTALTLELMRILENRLVYLQNFIVDPSSDNRILAKLVTLSIDAMAASGRGLLTQLEATYFRAVAALYAGDLAAARDGFAAACASEESDEANDIKYKSFVILGHISHEEKDYEKARELHDQSLRYSQNGNVTAQALALKALNAYALHDSAEALKLFEESLQLFDPDDRYFNSYFYRNALLFCGAIYYDRKDYRKSEDYYRRVLVSVDQSSYDHFDALSHLGRISYAEGRYDDAVATLEKAVRLHRFNENEYVVDTWFLIARAHLKRDDRGAAKEYLEKIAATEVACEKKPQAMELLGRM